MTLSELERLQWSLKYKGRSCLRVHTIRDPRNDGKPLPKGYVYLSVWIHAKDSHDDKRDTQIEIGCLVSIAEIERSNLGSQLSNIRDILIGLELHEVNETLTLDDKRIYDPHKSPRVRKLNKKRHLKKVA